MPLYKTNAGKGTQILGRHLFVVLIWTVAILLPVSSNAQYMRAPGEVGQQVLPAETVETSPVKIGLAGLVWIYRNGVSPVSPDRCGFMPSCSAYSALAVREHGPFWGVIMSADRLMRCHYLKKPGPFTPLLPNGKILDLPPNTPFPEFF